MATSVHLLRLARQRGAERAWLSVVADNAPALRLYEKLGFSPVLRLLVSHQTVVGARHAS